MRFGPNTLITAIVDRALAGVYGAIILLVMVVVLAGQAINEIIGVPYPAVRAASRASPG